MLIVLGLTAILAFQPPLAGHGPAAVDGDPPAAAAGPWITFRTDAAPEDIAAVGAVLVEAYPAFRIARGPADALTHLEARGVRATMLADASVIRFLSGPVDARELSRSAAAWVADPRGRATGVVHVHAPWKEAWGAEWRTWGIEVLRYLPTNAFLVRGSPGAIESLQALPYVDGVAPFAPAWKVRPGMPSDGLVDVRIVLLPGSNAEGLIAWLGGRGIPRLGQLGEGPGSLGSFGSSDFQWIRARIPAGLVRNLAERPEVEFIDPVRPVRPWNYETDWTIQVGSNITPLRYWQAGLDGRGQVVAISDTGLDYDHPQFREALVQITVGDIYNDTDLSRRKVVRYVNMGVLTGLTAWPGGAVAWDPNSIKDSSFDPGCTLGHGTLVSSVLAGNDNSLASSWNDGNALGAKLYVQDIGTVLGSPCGADGLAYIPEDYADLFGPPGLVYNDPDATVRIHSNSWGTDTNEYDAQARMVDAFVWSHPDMTILFAAGNAGSATATVGTPGTAKNAVTVGGAGNPDALRTGGPNDMATQSSRGPTSDGRIKPTIVTIFDGDSGASDGNPWSSGVRSDVHWDGTSYATPAAAAAAAIVRQYFEDGWYPAARLVSGNAREPSAALIRAILIASGVQMTCFGCSPSGEDRWPNNAQGFGRVLLANVLPIASLGDTFRTQVVDERAGLLTGEDATYSFRVTGARPTPTKFVLTWNDYPGTLGASKALVNDLDLEVTAPDGSVYRGNNFGTMAQGESVPDGSADSTNVEEAVILKTPATGEWRVRVIGANVPVGPQPFALVATGNLDASWGRVFLDRPSYGGTDTLRIEVEDAGATSAEVLVRSDLEPAGEVVPLSRGAPDEVWRGSVAVGFGTPVPDGIIQVRHGDAIRAEYADSSPAHTAVATARIDARGPVVWDVAVDRPSTTFARIRWQTDEPATSAVRYGTSPADLSSLAETRVLVRSHDLLVTGLQADTLYYFDVVSTDRSGQETRDTNAGQHHRLRTSAFGDVLLVIGHDSLPPEREATWANALDANRWTWSPWRVADAGLPNLTVLQAHRAVAWQVGLEQYPPFNDSARTLLKDYLDGGGRLLVSSHDTAWAFTSTDSQFRTPDADAWTRGVLKAYLQCDPTTALKIRGASGDPISDAFQAQAIDYAPHRDGGALDELVRQTTGPLASSDVWTDAQVSGCSGGPVGLRWNSTAANGTLGVGVWGGRPSRLVYYAFELTGLDATSTDPRPTSANRAAVLDNTLRWLVGEQVATLDRDHPDVTLTSPNGGTFAGPTITIAWTASPPFGAALGNFELSYSPDGGQTWTPIATVPPTEQTYPWTIAGLQNGDRYLVRVVARDTGSPSLKGQDESDAPFTITQPGGDTTGPSVWAGSVAVDPLPPGAGTVTRIGGTADDRTTGGGTIAGAEFFLGLVGSLPGPDGTGTPMDPADGTFDEPVEDLAWSDPLAFGPGSYCLWVHARDASDNWGPYESTCFPLLDMGPDVTPPSAARFASARAVNGGADIELVWERAPDESAFGGTVSYQVFRSPTAGSPGTAIGPTVLADGRPTYAYVDILAGSDPSDSFYRIETVDEAGNRAMSVAFAAKVRLALAAGPNLLGMPVEPADRTLASLAGGLSWTTAWTYDGCAGGTWSSAFPSEAASLSVGIGRGLWINASAAATIVLVGIVPATPRVDLCAGWNLVALPGFASGMAVGAVKAATGADLVVGFDPAGPYHTRVLGDAEVLAPGRGVWIRVPSNVAWTVAGS